MKKAYGVLTVFALGALLALSAGPAAAKQVRLLSGVFGSAASGPADPYPLSSGPFGSSSIAVDDTSGDVYVTDQGNHRVEKFTSSGEFLLMFGKGVNKTEVEASASEALQNVCTAASGDVCQPGARAGSPGAFDAANEAENSERSFMFVAVDNSSGASRGDVYVGDSGDHLITKLDSDGNVVASWGDNGGGGAPNGQLNGTGTGAGESAFAVFDGIAIDAEGNLWVASINARLEFNHGYVYEFHENGGFVKDWPGGEEFNGFSLGDARAGMAIDTNGDVYVGKNKYESNGGWIGSFTGEVSGIAVDSSSNELYAAAPVGEQLVSRYSVCEPFEAFTTKFCSPSESFGKGHLSEPRGVAVLPPDPAIAYVVQGTGKVAVFSTETVPDVTTLDASSFAEGAATLNGTVNPDGVALIEGPEGCRFEWGETEAYGQTAACEENATEIGSGASPVAVRARIGGLQQGKTYHYRLVAANANNVNALLDEPSTGQSLVFGPPAVDSGSALGVSVDAATLQGEVNPTGAETRVRIEYGDEAGVYTHSTPEVSVGAGDGDRTVSVQIAGLAPLTTYHYRVTAQNALGTVQGPDLSFTTQSGGVGGLPDNRRWEMVSPPEKNGIPLEALAYESGVIQAAADGSGLAYIAHGSIDSEPAGGRSFTFSQLLATEGPAGWSALDIATPHQAPAGFLIGRAGEYMQFSSDVSTGLVEPEGATPLAPQATERTPYLREPDGEFVPLVTPENVPAGTKFGGKEVNGESEHFGGGVNFVAATRDLNHVVLQSPSVLTEPLFSSGGHQSVYEWTAGALALVSQIPTGSSHACGGSGPACSAAAAGGLTSVIPGKTGSVLMNRISADGERVVFKSSSSSRSGLFLRDLKRQETLQLDVAVAGAPGGAGEAFLQEVIADGSKVFFTDSSRLTPDATATPGEPDLYMCEIGEASGHIACALKDVTVDANSGESANVLGSVIGAAEDGSILYFVANGRLAPGAVTGDCGASAPERANQAASCNLYSYEPQAGTVKLVAVLSEADIPDWTGDVTARVSPNGARLAFMSERPLTGYDNRDAVSGQRDEEVYLYDAHTGSLLCVSCNPTGQRPAGVRDPGSQPGLMLVDRPSDWSNRWLAASLPGWDRIDVSTGVYQSRYLSDEGRLFFDAADALAPQDSNGTEDVYQYEPGGVGGCTAESTSFAPATRGCLDLVSSGTSSEESAFLDASESGADAFFLTASRLAPGDVDSALDVYDARICSAAAHFPQPPTPPPACNGDACLQPVSAPAELTPGSLTFSGLGNLPAVSGKSKPKAKETGGARRVARALRACRRKHRHDRRARTRCERTVRKRPAAKGATEKKKGGLQ
ncbi:MAG: hypothetical protein ACTHM1_13105 [Solirubrobacteraceae bacterium]